MRKAAAQEGRQAGGHGRKVARKAGGGAARGRGAIEPQRQGKAAKRTTGKDRKPSNDAGQPMVYWIVVGLVCCVFYLLCVFCRVGEVFVFFFGVFEMVSCFFFFLICLCVCVVVFFVCLCVM